MFCILEKYVSICGNARKLIKSYFLIVLNVFKLIIFCQMLLILFVVFPVMGLGPLKLCLYLLPMNVILKYYKIGNHVYADDAYYITH